MMPDMSLVRSIKVRVIEGGVGPSRGRWTDLSFLLLRTVGDFIGGR